MGLDRCRRTFEADAFDHIRIERPLHQEFHPLDFPGLCFEILDEEPADGPSLTLRVCNVLESRQELLRPVQKSEIDLKMCTERFLNLFAFARPEDAVIDKHARQLVSDC